MGGLFMGGLFMGGLFMGGFFMGGFFTNGFLMGGFYMSSLLINLNIMGRMQLSMTRMLMLIAFCFDNLLIIIFNFSPFLFWLFFLFLDLSFL